MVGEGEVDEPTRRVPSEPVLSINIRSFSGYEFSNEPFPEMMSAAKKEARMRKYAYKGKLSRKRKPARELTGAEFNEVLRRAREQDVTEQSRELTAEKKEEPKASRKRKQPREQTDAEFNKVMIDSLENLD